MVQERIPGAALMRLGQVVERMYQLVTQWKKKERPACAGRFPSTMSVMALTLNMGTPNKLADQAMAAASISCGEEEGIVGVEGWMGRE